MAKRIIFSVSLISMCFIQCVHQEKETDPLTQRVVEMLEFPAIEDPDPPIEEPLHGELFAANLSVDPLKEMGTFTMDGRLTPLILEIFQSLETNQVHEPDLKELLQTVNVALILDVINPEKPLDPKLEGFLKKMLELEGMNLPLPELPEILPIVTDPRNNESERPADPEQALEDLDAACMAEVRESYESGFRGCSLDNDSNVQAINSNYQRRVYEAEERLLQRNEAVMALYGEKVLLVSNLLKEISKIVNGNPGVENYEEIRLKLSYFGLVYAYYIRINLPVLYEYALAVNQSFYEHEIKAIGEIRDNKLDEASAIFQACIDWVNGLIAKEIEETCR